MLQARLNMTDEQPPMLPPKAVKPAPPPLIMPVSVVPTHSLPQTEPKYLDLIDDLPPPLPETSPPSTPPPLDHIPLPPPPPPLTDFPDMSASYHETGPILDHSKPKPINHIPDDNSSIKSGDSQSSLSELTLLPPPSCHTHAAKSHGQRVSMFQEAFPDEERRGPVLSADTSGKRSVAEIVNQLKKNGFEKQISQRRDPADNRVSLIKSQLVLNSAPDKSVTRSREAVKPMKLDSGDRVQRIDRSPIETDVPAISINPANDSRKTGGELSRKPVTQAQCPEVHQRTRGNEKIHSSNGNKDIREEDKNKENSNTCLNNNTIKSGLSFVKADSPIEMVVITSPDTIPVCNVCQIQILR